jgi:broad specificity phosphatase PhoE
VSVTELLLIRHGESAGNVAREQAESDGAEVIDTPWRDPDAPLSEHGVAQATALGKWLAELPADRRPAHVWSSPYLRARDTAGIALDTAGLGVRVRIDERLRDRELGVLDRLTSSGVRARHPDEAQRRRWLGKLYYRPPGGESWADVALRLRSFLAELDRGDAAGPVLITAHDAVILLFCYILQPLDEPALLELAAADSVANASVTRLVRGVDDEHWRPDSFGDVSHLHRFGVEPTQHGRGADGSH